MLKSIKRGDFTEQQYLCLTDLLAGDLSGQEYFNTLPDNVRKQLLAEDEATTFSELQKRAGELKALNRQHSDITDEKNGNCAFKA